MPRIASFLPALLLVFVCVPHANGAVQYYLDANLVDATGGSFTVSASANNGEFLNDLGLDLRFSAFGGPLAGNNLVITSSVGHPGLADDNPTEPTPIVVAEGGSLLRFFAPNPGPSFVIPAAKTALATFSFTDQANGFAPNSSFTVSLTSVVTDPTMTSLLPDPITITTTAVPEPGTVVALACLAAGAGFKRRFSRKAAPAV